MAELITNGPVQTIASDNTDHFVLERRQDVEPILNHVQALDAIGAHSSHSGEIKHAAEFPMILVEQYCQLHGITFAEWMQNREHIRRMLNDPSLKAFRVWKGRV